MEPSRTEVPGFLDFAVSVHPAGDATIVEVRGDLDCYTAPKLRAVLVELADGPRKVILDVGRATSSTRPASGSSWAGSSASANRVATWWSALLAR